MSIWCSRDCIGTDPYDPNDPNKRGVVVEGMEGWSNWYPTEWDPPAGIDTALIPAWCVPGHEGEYQNDTHVGPWLRLSMTCDGLAVLDEEAAKALAEELLSWVALPKVLPPP